VATQRTEHRNADLGERRTQDHLVPVGTDPVQDHPADPHPWVEPGEPGHHGGDRAAHRGAVDHEHDRR
jgi:hypothetical protein